MRVHDDWLLSAHRAAVHLPTATAVIADLHLGYNQVRRRHGEAVPGSTLDYVADRIRLLCAEQHVSRLVIAGDLYEDARHPGPAGDLVGMLAGHGIEVVAVVPGNHDRQLGRAAPLLPLAPDGVELGRWRVLHGDGPPARGWVVQGHVHPCLRWRDLNAPCYLIGPRRLVLPAFSADAAGANVLGRLSWYTYRCGVIAGDRVLDFGPLARLRQRLAGAGGKRKRGPKSPFP